MRITEVVNPLQPPAGTMFPGINTLIRWLCKDRDILCLWPQTRTVLCVLCRSICTITPGQDQGEIFSGTNILIQWGYTYIYFYIFISLAPNQDSLVRVMPERVHHNACPGPEKDIFWNKNKLMQVPQERMGLSSSQSGQSCAIMP